ncbi:MBL fold metallo-hydrolase [Arenibaculum pallidiluteum]|uniref:MBL fold metallo-hydrolase n=1 Tax=Arenibaculum pallidiluteum TaxID=2812559 RepID=UPI001A9648BB|nr:MBL fold metallo-hydrolase [Arenibaculum pallidiluteum]
MAFDVTFWGVRGTVPSPTPDHMGYGGNTPCVEVMLDDRLIVLDCGTGLRGLGKALMEGGPRRGLILLSHLHLDHIAGFPFFAPAYSSDFSFRVLCGRPDGGPPLRRVMAGQMEAPLFPVPLREMQAELSFEDFVPGSQLDTEEGVRIATAPLNHPDGATGFRIDYDGASLAYVTDTEHVPGQDDGNVLSLIEGADLVIYDCTYTEAEWSERVGWGHSTWEEGVRLCRLAGARRLALFHHDPDRDDAGMAALERAATAAWPAAFAAREGMRIRLRD